MNEGRQTQEDLPPAQRHIIPRPRLTKLLDEAEARIILLVAPAGYGKTTLAREWLSQHGRRGLWYRARRYASDPVALAHGVATLLATTFPEAHRDLNDHLAAATSPDREPEVLADLLGQHIPSWPSRLWLVLDDYHSFIGARTSERFVAHFVAVSRANTVITSRERPAWISGRNVLYGEALELRRDSLAMTDEEAAAVLSTTKRGPSNLLSFANGWPAVIGLAALVPNGLRLDQEIPNALHDYLAEELYSTLGEDVQRQLAHLAVPNVLDSHAVTTLLAGNAAHTTREAARVGLITSRGDGSFEMHPLVRSFLQGKLARNPPESSLVRRLIRGCLDAANWDEAYALIEQHNVDELLCILLEKALPSVLQRGRVATLESWVAWADERGIEAPELSLARAELSLRRAEWQVAESLAVACAPLLPSPALTAQAYLCAATAAHLLEDGSLARAHCRSALAADTSPGTVRRASWSHFVSSIQSVAAASLDPDAYSKALEEFEAIKDATPVHLIRVSQARLIVATRLGDVAAEADRAIALEPLLADVDDPLVRSGFLNTLSDALTVSARYGESERIARAEMSEAERSRLTFVYPNAALNLAAARMGAGDYTGAEALVDQVERDGFVMGDPFLTVYLRALRIRIHVSRGAAHDVARLTFDEDVRHDIRGEGMASLALAQCCSGLLDDAERTIEQTEDFAYLGIASVLLAAARSVIADMLRSPDLTALLTTLAQTATSTGAYDGLICAVRGAPGLLRALLGEPKCLPALRQAAQRSGDPSLMTALGLERPRHEPGSRLSVREKEVLSLAAQGLRNTDIALRLFISPKTVKAHLQHIYEKLGVRSRTEAATKARDAGILS